MSWVVMAVLTWKLSQHVKSIIHKETSRRFHYLKHENCHDFSHHNLYLFDNQTCYFNPTNSPNYCFLLTISSDFRSWWWKCSVQNPLRCLIRENPNYPPPLFQLFTRQPNTLFFSQTLLFVNLLKFYYSSFCMTSFKNGKNLMMF